MNVVYGLSIVMFDMGPVSASAMVNGEAGEGSVLVLRRLNGGCRSAD
jgi:hypothetical protein